MKAINSSKPPTAPGLYRMSATDYHSDPCPEPSLSSSILKTLLNESPKHAAFAHPRLNPNLQERIAKKVMDFGSCVHKVVLGYGNEIAIVDPEDHKGPRGGIPVGWTNDSIKAAKAEAIAGGRIPILKDDFYEVESCAHALKSQVAEFLGENGWNLEDCHREVILVWQESGMWRRAMFDILTPDLLLSVDLKTSDASLNADKCSRRIYDMGYHIQAAHYTSGLDSVDPDGAGRRRFVFLFAEQSAPYAVSSPFELSEAGRTLADSQVATGSALWDSCLSRNSWPGYSRHAQTAEPPVWELTKWEDRMNGDESLNPQWHPEQLYGKGEKAA